jgi:penicillin-binding protein 2
VTRRASSVADVTRRSRLRLIILRVFVISLFLTLVGRLYDLQVVNGATYRADAADNQLRSVVTPAPRGLILDDMGRPLAENRTAMVVSVDRVALSRQSDGGAAVLRRLAGVLHVSAGDLLRRIQLCTATVKPPCWNGSPYQPIPVDSAATLAMAAQIEETPELFPGVSAQLQAVRYYPQPSGASAAHELGFLGPIDQQELAALPPAERAADLNLQVGRSGLEAAYNSYLEGTQGVQMLSVDHLGEVTGVVHTKPPVPGDVVVTSLNAKLQADLENILVGAVRNANTQGFPADTAAGVVMDRSGHVLAIASYPTYNPNLFVGGISTRNYDRLLTARGNPLDDWSIAGQFSPGSTFKLITASAVLQDGDATETGYYNCPSSISVGGHIFFNNEGEFGGSITLHQAIVESCDTVFYQFGVEDWNHDQFLIDHHKRPAEAVQHMAFEYGLGHPLGVDLPGEAPGSIPTRAYFRQEWLAQRHNWCAGARRRPRGSYLQVLDQQDCLYGYLFNPGDQVNTDIGQGQVTVTPLQLANAYVTLIDGGYVHSPRLVSAILSPTGRLLRRVAAPVLRRVPVNPGYLSYIENAMYGVTHDPTGTATGDFVGFPFNRVAVGGKTGTAEAPNGQMPTSLFASFAGRPGQPPQYVAVVVVPQGDYGAQTAAPAVRKIWDALFGLEGMKAALPGGNVPRSLPTVGSDGSVRPPSSVALGLPAAAVVALPLALPVERRRSVPPFTGAWSMLWPGRS